MIEPDDVPVPSSTIVFREEFDDWALLFDPDTGEVYAVNPVAAFVWKHMDGRRSVTDLASLVAASFENVPETADRDVLRYLEKLEAKGFLGFGAG